MQTFITPLIISMCICALSSFFVFFARRFEIFIIGCFGFLAGIILSFINTDLYANLSTGNWCIYALLGIFTFEFLAYRYCTFQKQTSVLGLAFLAFVTISMSTDLIMVLLGLMLFGLSFILLARQHKNQHTDQLFKQLNIALLTFAYGIAVIFSRNGMITLSDLRLRLSYHLRDEWLMFGFGLLILAVTTEIHMIFVTLKKDKK